MTAGNAATDRLPGNVITSVSDYLNYIENTCTNYPSVLFRGHRDETRPLLPKIAWLRLRDGYSRLSVEQEMFSEFKRRSLPHLNFEPRNDWEWLALAQHYRMPTRLLDWTPNPLAALWFAVERPANNQSRGTVWIFFTGSEDYVSESDIKNGSPFNITQTRVLPPNHITQRIVAQDGWFTVHQYIEKDEQFEPLENFNEVHTKPISRVAIPHDAFPSLRRELDRCGFNAASLYADLEGLSRHIEWRLSPLADED